MDHHVPDEKIKISMKIKLIFTLFLLIVLSLSAFSQPDLQQPFRDCGYEGSITIYDYRPSTYKDMTVDEVFRVSAGWVFIELAKKVGRKRYLSYLNAIGYGNAEVSNEADFWNFGPLAISPRNQVELLINAYEGKLPFSQRNIDILKRVMVTEKTDSYTIHSKTGWGWQNGTDVGWWVGYVERKDNVYFFATRITKDRKAPSKNFMSCRIDITKRILAELGAM